jgi:hypothetical protein
MVAFTFNVFLIRGKARILSGRVLDGLQPEGRGVELCRMEDTRVDPFIGLHSDGKLVPLP